MSEPQSTRIASTQIIEWSIEHDLLLAIPVKSNPILLSNEFRAFHMLVFIIILLRASFACPALFDYIPIHIQLNRTKMPIAMLLIIWRVHILDRNLPHTQMQLSITLKICVNDMWTNNSKYCNNVYGVQIALCKLEMNGSYPSSILFIFLQQLEKFDYGLNHPHSPLRRSECNIHRSFQANYCNKLCVWIILRAHQRHTSE